ETGNDCRMCSSISFIFSFPVFWICSSGRRDHEQAESERLGRTDAAHESFEEFGRVINSQHTLKLDCAVQSVHAVSAPVSFLKIFATSGKRTECCFIQREAALLPLAPNPLQQILARAQGDTPTVLGQLA